MDRIYRINKIQKVVRDALLINHANPVIMSKFADDLNVRSDPAANAPVLRPVLLQECLQELVTHHILAGLTCPFSHKARQVEARRAICEGRLPSFLSSPTYLRAALPSVPFESSQKASLTHPLTRMVLTTCRVRIRARSAAGTQSK